MKTTLFLNLINTPLQRGEANSAEMRNRFNGFSAPTKTAEAVGNFLNAVNTSLKRGVNENARRQMLHAATALASAFCLLHSTSPARAATTIDAANKYAYGANLGWMDWRGDTNNG